MEVLIDYGSGELMVRPLNPGATGQAITGLLASSPEFEPMRECGQATFHSMCNYDTLARNLLQHYEVLR